MASTSQRFTGQERDTESGIDFFKARYASAPQGRFQSPDPAGMFVADPTNPQSWNLYAYVMNNPLNYKDPTGMDCTAAGFDDGQGDTCAMIPQGPNNSVTVYGSSPPVNYGSWNTGNDFGGGPWTAIFGTSSTTSDSSAGQSATPGQQSSTNRNSCQNNQARGFGAGWVAGASAGAGAGKTGDSPHVSVRIYRRWHHQTKQCHEWRERCWKASRIT